LEFSLDESYKIFTMNTIDIRKELHSYIDNSTDDAIAAFYAFVKTHDNDHKESADIKENNSDIEQAMKEINERGSDSV
jgi:ABC-type transporter lipoprotein component MlaA